MYGNIMVINFLLLVLKMHIIPRRIGEKKKCGKFWMIHSTKKIFKRMTHELLTPHAVDRRATAP